MFKTTTITSAILALAATSALAQETQKLERIEVTGSSIKRVSAESSLPITTFTKEEIARSGATTVQDLVQGLPSSFGGGVVANNVGATGGASTANLRALGPKYTLVLLNGRRVANFAFGNNPVDLNSIPLAAVERVEIVRDGASSTYGADAVAGVINFILKKDYQGAEVTWAEYKSDKPGGNVDNISAVAGFGDLAKDRFNVMLTAGRETISPVKARDRSFGSTAVRDDLGINKSSPRNGIPNLNFTDTKGNTYTGVNPLRYKGCNAPEFGLATFGVPPSPTQCGTDYVKFIDLVPDQWRANFSARGVLQLDADNQLIVEGMHNRDRQQSFYSPAPYTKPMAYPTNGRFYPSSITLPKGMTLPKGYIMPDGSVLAADTVLANDMPVTPTGVLKGTWRTVAGGGRSDITETKTDRLLVGAKGTLAGWDYDTAVTFSRNKGEIYFGPGKFSYAILTPLVASGQINVFGPQDAASQALLDSALLSGQRQQAAESKSTEFDFKVSRDVMELAAGPLAVAVGVNFRKETLNQISDPVLASGDEVGGGGAVPTVSSGRKVYGVFGEVNIPIIKDLEANLAARYDNYKNDFGTSFNNFSPKASLRYQPTKDLVLRGSVAKGYRAPTLYENLRPLTTSNNTAANWSDPIRCPNGVPITNTINPVGDLQDECQVQLTAGTSGDKGLKPEKSRQFSFGLVFSPIKDMTMGVDYWNVEIKDPIVAKSEIQVLSDAAKYKDYIYRYDPQNDPDQLSPIKGSQNKDFPIAYVYLPYENTDKTYASGLDFNASYRTKVSGVGTVGFNYEGALFITHGYQYTGLSKTDDLGKFKDFGAVPRYRHAITGTWSSGMFDVSLTNNYTHSYEDYTDPTAVGDGYPLVRQVKAYYTWDTQFGVKPTKSLSLIVGIKNLLDKDPPSSRNSLYFQTGYDPTYTNPIGRQFYGRINYKFF
ncbi:MAG: TonB-dependent receptor [Burkholderiales bacterium]|jgi:iron complex outermembrane receptor protein|nr:TonB-dependent receptor [Burkholderiales bacterium]MBW8890636.1 TonB-dependent receptor [Burkholderiales bacterium]